MTICYSPGGNSLVDKSCPTPAIPWTVACQAPLSMRFSRQEDWSGLLFSYPGDLPDPGIEPQSPTLQADSFPTELQGKPNYSPTPKVSLLHLTFCNHKFVFCVCDSASVL